MGTFTEAMLMSKIRSALRNIWRFYKPRAAAKKLAEKTVKGKRHKLEYKCSDCKKWFRSKEVEVNHKSPAGSRTCFEDIPSFCERLFCEDPQGYTVLCKNQKNALGKITRYGCHYKETYGKK